MQTGVRWSLLRYARLKSRTRSREVVANDGELRLLSIGLLIGHRLTVDYIQLTVTIE
jgi:hypothetical protein